MRKEVLSTSWDRWLEQNVTKQKRSKSTIFDYDILYDIIGLKKNRRVQSNDVRVYTYSISVKIKDGGYYKMKVWTDFSKDRQQIR